MAFVDYFPATVAVDPLTDAPLENAEADVYAIDDTDFTTPLAITDVQGVALAKLVSGPLGIFPAFMVPGYTQVVPKVGDVVNPPITSIMGPALAVVPDPTSLPDGHVMVVQAGEWVAVAFPGITSDGTIERAVKVAESVYDDLAADDLLEETTFYAVEEGV